MVRPRLYFAFPFPSSALLGFVRRIPQPQSASRRRAEAALWRVAFHPPQGLAAVPVRVKESCRLDRSAEHCSA
jgi:hypothetical protein